MSQAPRALPKVLSLREAIALYFGSVLGTGVLISPPLAATEAGPASLWVWAAFAALSYPVAITLGRLPVRRPTAGGVSVFVQEAFGPIPGAAAGWLFLAAFVVGAPTAALVGSTYLVPALQLPGGRMTVFFLAAALMATTTLVNYLGVIPSGRTQLIAMLAIVGFLMSAIAAGSLRFHPSNLTPITPRDLPSLGGAGAIIFWSFLGWENAVHAAEELRDPTKDLRRAAALSVLLIGSLYFSLGLITVGARAYYDDPQQDALAFALLLGDVMGGGAFVAAGVLAFLVTLATLNAYTLGVSRLVFGMAREGSMPSALAALHPRHRVPHRTLLLLLGLGSGALLVIGLLDLDYTTLFLLVGASFIILYLMAAGAAVRTLRGRALRAYALVTLVAFLIFLTLLGLRSPSSLLYPAAAALIALAVLGLSRRRRQPSRGEGGIL